MDIPYPWESEQRITASNAATAAARALRDIRKQDRLKGKKLKHYKIIITAL